MRDRKKNKRKEKTVPVRFPQKQIEKKLRVIVLRLRVRIGVRDNRCRHVRRSGLAQSLKSESVKGHGPENLLRLDTAAVKEVTKEGRDVSGLGACEVLVVRENMYMTSRFRSLWRTETKKKQRVDLILGVPILISLGAKLAAWKTFYGWVARVAIVCIHVHECPARHRHQEERRVLQFFFVAPCAACMSCAQRSHHAQLA